MYENNNTVSIDWKGLFIKLIIVALIIFAIFKGYEYFSNNKKIISSTNGASQLFNANLEKLKLAGENYFDYSNYPSEGQTVMVTLAELLTKGDINEMYDEKGNTCSRENSYVAVTNDGGQYKLKASLVCGETTNYTVNTIGCECEGDECTQAIKKLESQTSSSSSKETTKESKKEVSLEKEETTKAKKTTTKPEQLNAEKETTKRTTTTTPKTTSRTTTTTTTTTTTPTTHKRTTKVTIVTQPTKTYTVKFDSNGGDKVATQYVERYDTAYEPNEPEKDDARFVGWYYNGRLWDFDTEITKNITLEAYYWETKTLNKSVYTAAWDDYGTSYVTVTHKLAIPTELQKANIKNVKIKTIKNERTMSSANDLYYQSLYHSSTFDGYINNGYEYEYNQYAGYTLGRLYNINAGKTYSAPYDRWVTWYGYVGNQCSATFDGSHCNYGIVYTVVWEYDEFTD